MWLLDSNKQEVLPFTTTKCASNFHAAASIMAKFDSEHKALIWSYPRISSLDQEPINPQNHNNALAICIHPPASTNYKDKKEQCFADNHALTNHMNMPLHSAESTNQESPWTNQHRSPMNKSPMHGEATKLPEPNSHRNPIQNPETHHFPHPTTRNPE